MNFESVKEYIKSAGLPNFRIAQVRDAVYKHGITSWEEATSLPAQIRQDLAEKYPILSFKVSKMVFSKADKAAKALLTLQDGRQIETVLLKPQDTWSVCVSSQVGDRISSVVFMGMGEPLLNYLNVVKAAQTLSNPDYLNIGARHISVSTAGIADKLHKLAVDLPQANLAVSLHNADDSERSKLMPVNRRFNLEELQKAVEEYIAMTGRQVFLEYAVLENVNSRPEHIRKLAKWIYGIKDNYLIHVNLIACNLGRGMKTDDKVVKDFAAAVKAMGIGVTIRKSMGNDVLAACGQLAANK